MNLAMPFCVLTHPHTPPSTPTLPATLRNLWVLPAVCIAMAHPNLRQIAACTLWLALCIDLHKLSH